MTEKMLKLSIGFCCLCDKIGGSRRCLMQKYIELTRALEYIENHILDNCLQIEIAQSACVSLSALQKMFRFTFGYSVNEYIMKRKMTLATEELSETEIPISQLALKYGYTSTEAFSRAFSK
ncbi:AraC family transcriptional regulator [Lachnospiraceae bacterium]|nr:AraC family transcriptional regulator [Lachnospiraceae bacterium]